MKKTVAIIGDARCERGSVQYQLAFDTARLLVDEGFRIQCGGLGGVMMAACEGAHAAQRYQEGDTIALIPSFDRKRVNPYADIVIPTGLDIMRNAVVGNADAVVAIGGGAGTLSEMAIAWSLYRLIIGFTSVEGWSKKLAGTQLDSRPRYDNVPEDCIYPASTPDEAVALVKRYVDVYTRPFEGLNWKPD